MNVELLKEEKQVLLHTLGLSEGMQFYEKEKILSEPYRNYFFTHKNTVDYPFIQSLIQKDLMVKIGERFEGEYFSTTDQGKNLAVSIALNSIKKLTRSKKRYALYLHCDIDESFSEWIKNPYWNDYRKRNGVS
jgi:hypothetical protein